MFMYMLFYVFMPFAEERSEFKKIQPISPHLFWTVTYLFDALLHTLVMVLLMAITMLYDLPQHFFGATEFGE